MCECVCVLCLCVCLCVLLLGVCGVRGRSISVAWPGRVMIMGSSTTLMLLHCISSCSRLNISSAREHLNAKIPARGLRNTVFFYHKHTFNKNNYITKKQNNYITKIMFKNIFKLNRSMSNNKPTQSEKGLSTISLAVQLCSLDVRVPQCSVHHSVIMISRVTRPTV